MIRINLAPPERRARRKAAGAGFQFQLPEFNLGILFVAVYVVALLAGGFWWNHLRTREAELTTQVKQSTEELNVLKAKVNQAGKIKDQLADLTKRVDAIQELTKSQSRLIVMLDSLANTVPRDLWLTALEERGTTLRVQGTSYTSTAVADFMSNLRSSGRFKDIEILRSQQDLARSPRLVTFEITCRFES